MMAAPPEADNSMPIRCSKCSGETTVKEATPGEDGKPLCKKCFHDALREWQLKHKDDNSHMEDMI